MKIYFEEISDETIEAAFVDLKRGSFKAKDVECAFNSLGVKNSVRAADRALQKLKREGRLFFSGGSWSWKLTEE